MPRGHWPAGKRRNAHVKPPLGWPTLEAFLLDLRTYCESHRGALADMARALDVQHSAARNWIAGKKWPGQRRVKQLEKWYRSKP